MRFGLVGVGGIGEIRARSLYRMPDCQLAGLTDIDSERAKALAAKFGGRVFENFESMIAAEEIEAVIISTPPQFHETLAIAALEAGKHVLCEKPLSNSVEACRRMVEAAQRTGRVLTTGFNHRYFPAIQFVKNAIDQGLIGELDHVRAFGGHTGLSEFKAPWMYDKKVMGGGALMDVGIHLLDLTRYLLGDVTEVFGVATSNVWKLEVEDNALAVLRNSQGKSAILQATWNEWKGYRFHIEAYGDKGMARAYYAPMTSTLIRMDRPGGRARKERHFYPMNILREKRFGWQSTVVTTFQHELRDFAALCRKDEAKKPNSIIADGFSGFRAVEIANAIYRSSAEKSSVRLVEPF